MIQRNEIHPETFDDCLQLAKLHEEELEKRIDEFLEKKRNEKIRDEAYFCIPVDRYSFRAIENIRNKYTLGGWGVMVCHVSFGHGSRVELRIQW
jgi:hypothetical protein